MELATRLRDLRLRQGLTQAAIAAPDYTAAYVSSIEAGKRHPSSKAIEHFARQLGVEVDELTTGRDPAVRVELLLGYTKARQVLASGTPESIAEARERFLELIEKARTQNHRDVEAKALVGVALCHEAANDLEGALTMFEETIELLADAGPLDRVDAVVGRARVLQTTGEVARATFLVEKAMAELAELGIEDPSALLRLHTSLVASYFDAGLQAQADASASRALELAVSVDDPERLATMNLNVGIALAEQRRWREAEVRLAEAERWFDEIRYAMDLARVRLVRGINFRHQALFDQGRQLIESARADFEHAGATLREARATVALGLLERAAGRTDEARFLLKRATTLAGDDRGIAGIALRELALCDAERDVSKAVAGLRHAIDMLAEAGLVPELAVTYRELGDLLSSDPDLSMACDAYKKAADLFEQAA